MNGGVVLYGPNGHRLPTRSAAESLTISQIEAIIRREKQGGGVVNRPFSQIAACYSCIVQTANAFAQIRFSLWRRKESAKKADWVSEVTSPYARRLKRPHPRLSAFKFREMWMTYLLAGGNVWCFPDTPDLDGVPSSFMLFGRDTVKPIRDGTQGPLLGWEIGTGRGRKVPLRLDELIHWSLPNPYDPVMGLAPHEALQAELDADYAATLYDKSFYQHSARPSAILLQRPGSLGLDEKQREELRTIFEEALAGQENAGRIAVIPGEFDLKPWGIEQSQAQFMEKKKFTREQIASAYFGFPVVLLNSQESGGLSRAELEAARLILMENCVIPHTVRFDEEWNSIVTDKIDPDLYVELDVDDIPVVLMSRMEAKSKIFDRFAIRGVPINVAINMLNFAMDPVPGGDVGYLPGNYKPLTELSGEDDPALPDDSTDEGDEDENSTASLRRLPAPKALPSPLQPITTRMRDKMRRFLWDIRRQACKAPGELTGGLPDSFRTRAARTFLPLVVAASLLGKEQTEYSHAKGPAPWGMVMGAGTIRHELEQLQRHIDQIELPRSLDDECYKHTVRLLEFLDETARQAAVSRKPQEVLAALDRASRLIADETMVWACNAGRYLAATEHRLPFKIAAAVPCSAKSHGERYPGDGNKDFWKMHGCGCEVVVVEEGQA